jgi:hypothetical protein
MKISSNVCTIHSNRDVGSFKTMAQLVNIKGDQIAPPPQTTQNFAQQQQHVHNSTGASMEIEAIQLPMTSITTTKMKF